MAALTLTLLDGTGVDRIDDVTSIVAADATGQFGLQPRHAEFVTVLEVGLFRYRTASEPAWVFGACLGGLLRCVPAAGHTDVHIVSTRILHGGEPEVLKSRLDELLQREGSLRVSTRESQLRMDLALHKRLQQLAQTHA
jgi:F-type H+-transporting ATPase subunit epsilon